MSERVSNNHDIWALKPPNEDVVAQMVKTDNCPPFLAQCLASRGISSGSELSRFLEPSAHDFLDPYAILNMSQAVQRLQQAVRQKETIRVVTDYDVDGTTSSLILQSTLRLIGGGEISYHIPDRMKEGYGFSVAAAEKAKEDGVQLILTADIGVKDHAAVQRSFELGIDVLICDHHLPSGAEVPAHAIVLCPPQSGCTYPNKALAACGVSWKLASALLANHPKKDRVLNSLLKLVAIGTVADVVDLACAENRAIVQIGLEQLNAGGHTAGLQALLDVSGLEVGKIAASDLGFRVGPRINAAGRLASATSVIDLLQCREPTQAKRLAQELDRMNTRRREIQDRILKEAIVQVAEEAPSLVVVSGEESNGWHRGVTGIVAGRLRDHFGCPALVITVTEVGCVGSMRSTPSVHAVNLLESASDLLERFGGHPAAAGFSLEHSELSSLENRLKESLKTGASSQEKAPSQEADLRLDPEELTLDLVGELEALEPTGKGNEAVVIWLNPTEIQGLRMLKEKHLKGSISTSAGQVEVLWWNAAPLMDEILTFDQVELIGRLGINQWRGRQTLQFQVTALRPA